MSAMRSFGGILLLLGILGFFYDMKEMPWGFRADDALSWRFVWHDELRPLERTPAVPEQHGVPQTARLIPSVVPSLPSFFDETTYAAFAREFDLDQTNALLKRQR